MRLTEDLKKYIDKLSYEELLRRWRFAPAGDSWFEGETGDYWAKVMAEKRDTVDHVAVSKRVGWKK